LSNKYSIKHLLFIKFRTDGRVGYGARLKSNLDNSKVVFVFWWRNPHGFESHSVHYFLQFIFLSGKQRHRVWLLVVSVFLTRWLSDIFLRTLGCLAPLEVSLEPGALSKVSQIASKGSRPAFKKDTTALDHRYYSEISCLIGIGKMITIFPQC
jgi:hypothetical protein